MPVNMGLVLLLQRHVLMVVDTRDIPRGDSHLAKWNYFS